MYIYIRSMSDAQAEVYRKIVSASDQITSHITKLLLFPNCKYTDHWMHEIWSFLPKVSKLKGSNRFPKSEFIKKALATNNDILESYIAIAADEESDLQPTEVTPDKLLRCIVAYQEWLAGKLASAGYVVQSEVKNKLSEICNI